MSNDLSGPVRILVTGAEGFVGRHLVAHLHSRGQEVGGAIRPTESGELVVPSHFPRGVTAVGLELHDSDSIQAALAAGWDAVVHLAAVASGVDARRDPIDAWRTNVVGTARLLTTMEDPTCGHPSLLFVSTGEVYGTQATKPIPETHDVFPCSPYAATKVAAEIAVLEAHRRSGFRAVIARTFPHTGPGQDTRFVVPAFVDRVRKALSVDAPAIKVGNLEPIRDFLHVRDVVEAYALLLQEGEPGEVYNVCSGEGVSVGDVFDLICTEVGCRIIPEVDASLVRRSDIPYLVGDNTKLRNRTGWSPTITLEQTIAELANAETN